jgi:hypothetical protein
MARFVGRHGRSLGAGDASLRWHDEGSGSARLRKATPTVMPAKAGIPLSVRFSASRGQGLLGKHADHGDTSLRWHDAEGRPHRRVFTFVIPATTAVSQTTKLHQAVMPAKAGIRPSVRSPPAADKATWTGMLTTEIPASPAMTMT